MGDQETQGRRDDIFTKAVRAGKRTYFFDVKATRANQYYLTITESKRRFNSDQGKFYYEKHKLFLYQEDFEKFRNGLEDALNFILTSEKPTEDTESELTVVEKTQPESVDVSFEDLGNDELNTSD